MTPYTVINAVRERLGDIDKDRWDDATLMLYVSMCQSDICMHTALYKREHIIELVEDQLRYPLPTDFLALNRIEYNGQNMPIESRNTIDSGDAVFPCALKDNLIFSEIEIVLGNNYDLLHTALVNVYGVVANSQDLNNVHGVVATVETTADEPIFLGLELYYTAIPPIYHETDMERDLIVPDVWFGAFLHYVCGMALQDDNDASNIQRGELEATKYVRLLANIMKVMAKDSTSNINTKLTTRVRRI